MDEAKQQAVWKLSGGYAHLEGFEPLTATPPEPVVVNGAAADKDQNQDKDKDKEPKGETTGEFYN